MASAKTEKRFMFPNNSFLQKQQQKKHTQLTWFLSAELFYYFTLVLVNTFWARESGNVRQMCGGRGTATSRLLSFAHLFPIGGSDSGRKAVKQ